MIVGNLGSRDRLAYTAVGDPVNVASRLEGLSKEYGVHIVIGEATRQAAGDLFEYRFLDLVAVKGRAEPVRVYELLGRAGSTPSRAAADSSRATTAASRSTRVAGGWRPRRSSRISRRQRPTTAPSRCTAGGARELLEQPPGSDWDGVWIAKTK